MSELHTIEMYKSFLLAFCAGFFGGILSHAVREYFARTRGIQASSFKDRFIQYAGAGLVYGTATFLIVWAALQSYSFASTNLFKNVNRFSIPIAILYPPVFAVILELMNITFKRHESDRT
jgi:H+/Cl- antiporter ClcA